MTTVDPMAPRSTPRNCHVEPVPTRLSPRPSHTTSVALVVHQQITPTSGFHIESCTYWPMKVHVYPFHLSKMLNAIMSGPISTSMLSMMSEKIRMTLDMMLNHQMSRALTILPRPLVVLAMKALHQIFTFLTPPKYLSRTRSSQPPLPLSSLNAGVEVTSVCDGSLPFLIRSFSFFASENADDSFSAPAENDMLLPAPTSPEA